jgi:hypothetical protein
MPYTTRHKPVEFRVVQGFWVVKGHERYGWRVQLVWDKKLRGSNRRLMQYCPHVHRTESSATECGQKALKNEGSDGGD